jgi:hypothetical protein
LSNKFSKFVKKKIDMSNIYWEEHLGNSGSKKTNESEHSTISAEFHIPPKPVGGYDITGNKGGAHSHLFMMTKKPMWFHRVCTRFFLGWTWVDGDGLNKTK